jgi:hypothetical protein
MSSYIETHELANLLLKNPDGKIKIVSTWGQGYITNAGTGYAPLFDDNGEFQWGSGLNKYEMVFQVFISSTKTVKIEQGSRWSRSILKEVEPGELEAEVVPPPVYLDRCGKDRIQINGMSSHEVARLLLQDRNGWIMLETKETELKDFPWSVAEEIWLEVLSESEYEDYVQWVFYEYHSAWDESNSPEGEHETLAAYGVQPGHCLDCGIEMELIAPPDCDYLVGICDTCCQRRKDKAGQGHEESR